MKRAVMTEEIINTIRLNKGKIPKSLIINDDFSNPFITDEHRKMLFNDWFGICRDYYLSEDFIREFKEYLNFEYICYLQILSEEFIREFQNELNWAVISERQKLSESFIREFKDKVYWDIISQHQKLSEDFIREFKDKVNWNYISKYQKLSEKFIKEFKYRVNWIYISKYQKLSEVFIKIFYNDIYGHTLTYIDFEEDEIIMYLTNFVRYQYLSEEFLSIIRNKAHPDTVSNWIHCDEKVKKFIVEGIINLYEYYDDYFIAYKVIRSDNYSTFNFQYKYEVGNTYECHANHTSNENSFGLSVLSKEYVHEYAKCIDLPTKIVKVKVYYKDIARVLHDGGMMRCSKFEVLSEEE